MPACIRQIFASFRPLIVLKRRSARPGRLLATRVIQSHSCSVCLISNGFEVVLLGRYAFKVRLFVDVLRALFSVDGLWRNFHLDVLFRRFLRHQNNLVSSWRHD